MRPPAPQHDAVTISEEGRRLDLDLDMSKTPTGKRWQDFFFLSEHEELDTSFPPVLEYYASTAQVVNLLVTFPAEEEGWRWSQGLDQTKLLCAVASHLSQFTSLTTLDITFQVPGPGHYNPHDRYMNAGRARIKNIIYFWTLPFQDWNFWVLDLGTDEWTKYFVEEEGYTERDLRLMRYAAELEVKEMKMEEKAQWAQWEEEEVKMAAQSSLAKRKSWLTYFLANSTTEDDGKKCYIPPRKSRRNKKLQRAAALAISRGYLMNDSQIAIQLTYLLACLSEHGELKDKESKDNYCEACELDDRDFEPSNDS